METFSHYVGWKTHFKADSRQAIKSIDRMHQ
jgi:hypothetical protein